MRVTDPDTGKTAAKRILLEDYETKVPVHTLAAATREMNRLKTKRSESTLVLQPKRTPKFEDYAKTYFEWHNTVGTKKPKTLHSERSFANVFCRFAGHLRLNQITRPAIFRYIEHRKKAGVSGRTINLEIIVVRAILKHAINEGVLRMLPFEGIQPLKYTSPKRPLLSPEEIDRICEKALEASDNGQQLADLVRLLACCGGRLSETLSLRWQDIDFKHRQLHFGREGDAKNREHRVVDFNDALAAHLEDMAPRRQPDSEWVFPRWHRGERDIHAKSFDNTLRVVRKEADVPHFTFHLLRHHFASYAVMAGIDFMTIAGWLGHKDGGILVGKTYGHLADEHRKAMADKLVFRPQAVPEVVTKPR